MATAFEIGDEIRALEESHLEPDVRTDREKLGLLLADQFIEFGSSGCTWNKESLLAEVPTQTGVQFSLTEFVAEQLAQNLVQTRYKLSTRKEGTERHSLRSSLWVVEKHRERLEFLIGTDRNAE